MSVITLDMILAFQKLENVTMEAAAAALSDWEAGRGELKSALTEDEPNRSVFASLRAAYWAAKDMPAPEYPSNEQAGASS